MFCEFHQSPHIKALHWKSIPYSQCFYWTSNPLKSNPSCIVKLVSFCNIWNASWVWFDLRIGFSSGKCVVMSRQVFTTCAFIYWWLSMLCYGSPENCVVSTLRICEQVQGKRLCLLQTNQEHIWQAYQQQSGTAEQTIIGNSYDNKIMISLPHHYGTNRSRE